MPYFFGAAGFKEYALTRPFRVALGNGEQTPDLSCGRHT